MGLEVGEHRGHVERRITEGEEVPIHHPDTIAALHELTQMEVAVDRHAVAGFERRAGDEVVGPFDHRRPRRQRFGQGEWRGPHQLGEVIGALVGMGWKPNEAEQACTELVIEEGATIEVLLRQALRSMPR